jgi:hypothetical protein
MAKRTASGHLIAGGKNCRVKFNCHIVCRSDFLFQTNSVASKGMVENLVGMKITPVMDPQHVNGLLAPV